MAARKREYFHLRGTDGRPRDLTLEEFRDRVRRTIQWAFKEHLLSERCGYECVDGDSWEDVQREFASLLDLEGYLRIEAPVHEHLSELSEPVLLGLHEIIHDLVSKATATTYHSYGQCGDHPTAYDTEEGREAWIDRVNQYLGRLPPGYRMDDEGRIELLLDDPAAAILDSPLPPDTEPAVVDRVERAVARFKRGTTSWDDREAALRDLADVLERIRPKAKARLHKKDERDLFQLLNQFRIRHFDHGQRDDYDRPIFLTWAFYECLAAIHACERLADRADPT